MTSALVISAGARAGGYAARIRHAIPDWPLLLATSVAVLGLGVGLALAMTIDPTLHGLGLMSACAPWAREVGVLPR